MSEQQRMQGLFRAGALSLARATGWREVYSTGRQIVSAGRDLRKLRDTHDSEAGATQDHFDTATMAERYGVSQAEIIKRMQNRRTTTKWTARVYAGGLGFCAVNGMAALLNGRLGVLVALPLLAMSVMLLLGLAYNVLINWQLRVGHRGGLGELLQHPDEWWPC